MITIADGWLVITRNGRTVRIQRLTDESYFQALRAVGVSETIAQALTAKLITVSTKGKRDD